MPLIYKEFQAKLANKEGKKLYYPVLVKFRGDVNTQQIGEMIAQKASLTPGDVHNVVRNLMAVMREQLLNSRTVKLDGLGTFTMIAHAGGRGVETAKEVNPSQIKYLKCQFTPEFTVNTGGGRTRALTTGVEYIHVKQLVKAMADADGGSTGGGGIVDPIA